MGWFRLSKGFLASAMVVGVVAFVTLRQGPVASDNDESPAQRHRRATVVTNEFDAATMLTEDSVLYSATDKPFARRFASRVGPVSNSSSGLWQNAYNVVHVINTRFQQHQAHLPHLSRARLDLLQTFTAPSLHQQTNGQFLWLLWVDHRMAEPLRHDFLQVMDEFPNAVVVTGRADKTQTLRTLYGNSWNELGVTILAGNPRLLADYYRASHDHILVETRLDADDALSATFVESAQSLAAASLGHELTPSAKVEYYCPHDHLEWRYYSPRNAQDAQGRLLHYRNEKFCINSGLTTVSHTLYTGKESSEGRRLQVSSGNSNTGSDTGVCGGVPTRRLKNQRYINRKPVMPQPVRDQCRPTYVPEHAEHSTFKLDPFNLHTARRRDHDDACRGGGQLCVGTTTYVHSRLSYGSTLLREWLKPDEDEYFVVCIPDRCTDHQVTLRVLVTERNAHDDPTALMVDVWPQQNGPSTQDYKLTEAFVKGDFDYDDASGRRLTFRSGEGNRGGNLYDWRGSNPSDDNDWGGVFGDYFRSPSRRRSDNGQVEKVPMKYIDFCVKPYDPTPPPPAGGSGGGGTGGGQCTRRLQALPRDEEDEELHDVNFYGNRTQQQQPQSLSIQRLRASVLMARTPTAAGMKHVLPSTETTHNSVLLDTLETDQAAAWQTVLRDFGVNHTDVAALRAHMEANMENILVDAINGQCTTGHSCKESAKKALGYLLDKVQQRHG